MCGQFIRRLNMGECTVENRDSLLLFISFMHSLLKKTVIYQILMLHKSTSRIPTYCSRQELQ